MNDLPALLFYGLLALLTVWLMISSVINLVKAIREGDNRRIMQQSALIAVWTAIIIFVFAAEMRWGHAITGHFLR